jgi:hypothetical protein
MFCPSCKCEYVRGITLCAECGVALVDSLPSEEDAERGAELVGIWAGGDSGELETVKDALDRAGITSIDREAAGYLFFPSMQPQHELFVARKDLERAKDVVAGLGLWRDPAELTEEERASLELPESDAAGDAEATDRVDDAPEEWDEEGPAIEIWSGGEENFAENLADCLREVGIASRKLLAGGSWSLAVRPEQETRAREIVREVVEAAPPE